MNEKLPIIVGGYSAGATIGSLFLAYGLRTFLRATGGGYYCCNHLLYQGQGILLAFIGWTVLVAVAIGMYRDRHRVTHSPSASRTGENSK